MAFELVVSSIITTILLGLLIFFVLWKATCRPRGIPPGPPISVPFLGNLPLLFKGNDIRKVFQDLRNKYGDVFSVYMGNKLWIVLNGHETIKDALVKHSEIFSDRPTSFFTNHSSPGQDTVKKPEKLWRDPREFTQTILQHLGSETGSMESRVIRELSSFLDAVEAQDGEPIDISPLFKRSVCNVMCSFVFGRRLEYEDSTLRFLVHYMEEKLKYLGRLNAVSVFPKRLLLVLGDLLSMKKMSFNGKMFKQLIRDIVEENKVTCPNGRTPNQASSYILEMRKQLQGNGRKITAEEQLKILGDLFIAGLEPTSTTLSWALIYLLRYPDMQAKLRAEIHSVVGRSRFPTMADSSNLPYTQAFISEVQRHVSVMPLLMRGMTRDSTFQGHFIPKGAWILVNMDSIMKDNTLWGDSDEFRPARFLNDSGNISFPEEFTPFGLGQRACIGDSLARMELFLYLTAMVQFFTFTSPDSPPPLKGVLGYTYMPNAYKLCAERYM